MSRKTFYTEGFSGKNKFILKISSAPPRSLMAVPLIWLFEHPLMNFPSNGIYYLLNLLNLHVYYSVMLLLLFTWFGYCFKVAGQIWVNSQRVSVPQELTALMELSRLFICLIRGAFKRNSVQFICTELAGKCNRSKSLRHALLFLLKTKYSQYQ